MFKEERYLKKHFGHADGFSVPKGYFDGLESRIMGSLPGSGGHAVPSGAASTVRGWLTRSRRAVVGVAAGVCLAMLPLGAYLHKSAPASGGEVVARTQAEPENHSQQNLEAFMEYSMMDTEDMYSYIADAR